MLRAEVEPTNFVLDQQGPFHRGQARVRSLDSRPSHEPALRTRTASHQLAPAGSARLGPASRPDGLRGNGPGRRPGAAVPRRAEPRVRHQGPGHAPRHEGTLAWDPTGTAGE